MVRRVSEAGYSDIDGEFQMEVMHEGKETQPREDKNDHKDSEKGWRIKRSTKEYQRVFFWKRVYFDFVCNVLIKQAFENKNQ